MLILTYGWDKTIQIDNGNTCTGDEQICRLALYQLADYISFDGDPHKAYADAINKSKIAPYFKVVEVTPMEAYNPDVLY
jgi:hypothetical protein